MKCVYHSRDLDGWFSAAIVRLWWEFNHPEGKVFDDFNNQNPKPEEHIEFIGWDYGQPNPFGVKDKDKNEIVAIDRDDEIIMVDVAFPKNHKDENIMLWINKFAKRFIWVDHHISAIKEVENDLFNDEKWIGSKEPIGLRNIKYAACELAWQYFFPDQEMPEIVRLIGRYDCFGHKGTDEEQKVLEFQYGARSVISNYQDAYDALITNIKGKTPHNVWLEVDSIARAGDSIYEYLKTEAKQIYEKAFPESFTLWNHKNEETYKFACVNRDRFNPINFGIDYHKDGYDGFACFWYDGKKNVWTWSLYNDNGEVDCSEICKQFGGGGHKGAAGFTEEELFSNINYYAK